MVKPFFSKLKIFSLNIVPVSFLDFLEIKTQQTNGLNMYTNSKCFIEFWFLINFSNLPVDYNTEIVIHSQQ